MEQHGIDEDWIIKELKTIADDAMVSGKDGMIEVDYRTKLKAVKELSAMGKFTGSMEGVTSIIKTLMSAQGVKTGDGINFNLTKVLYQNN